MRDEAEEYLRKVVQDKVAELEAEEFKLKQQVELLWVSYKQNISESASTANGYRGTSGAAKSHQSTPSRTRIVSPGPGHVNGTSASVRIREFVPLPNVPRRPSGVISPPQHSALSSSLATTNFHHPRAQSESHARQSSTGGSSPPPYSPSQGSGSPSRHSATGAASLATASSRTLNVAPDTVALSIRDAHRRNMDENLDTATSYRYQTDLRAEMEAEMERGRALQREVEPASPAEPPAASGSTAPPRGRSPRTSKSAIKKPKANGDSASPSTKRSTSGEGDKETPTKGKRKVTFDVRPDVAIISPGAPIHKLDDSRPEQG